MAIDGKTLRRSFDKATARVALHLVSAWAVSQKLSLASVAVEQKSNEITAIPELLKLIELSGAIVTIDAMGCQAEIAKAIVAGGGDYILAVKGNQPTLHEGIVEHFLDQMDDDFARVEVSRHETKEKGHGREEHRTYYVLDVPARPARCEALEGAGADRHGRQPDGAGRQGMRRRAVLHPQPEARRPAGSGRWCGATGGSRTRCTGSWM